MGAGQASSVTPEMLQHGTGRWSPWCQLLTLPRALTGSSSSYKGRRGTWEAPKVAGQSSSIFKFSRELCLPQHFNFAERSPPLAAGLGGAEGMLISAQSPAPEQLIIPTSPRSPPSPPARAVPASPSPQTHEHGG